MNRNTSLILALTLAFTVLSGCTITLEELQARLPNDDLSSRPMRHAEFRCVAHYAAETSQSAQDTARARRKARLGTSITSTALAGVLSVIAVAVPDDEGAIRDATTAVAIGNAAIAAVVSLIELADNPYEEDEEKALKQQMVLEEYVRNAKNVAAKTPTSERVDDAYDYLIERLKKQERRFENKLLRPCISHVTTPKCYRAA